MGRKKEARKLKQQTIRQSEDVCVCPECGEPYDDEYDETWVECEGCCEWFHLKCTELGEGTEDIEDVHFICQFCNI